MVNEIVVASVTLKSRSGLSIFKDFDKFTFSRVAEFSPEPDNVNEVAKLLEEAGFKIEAQGVTLSISGPLKLFEEVFNVKISSKVEEGGSEQTIPQKLSIYRSSKPIMNKKELEEVIEGIILAAPGVPFHEKELPD